MKHHYIMLYRDGFEPLFEDPVCWRPDAGPRRCYYRLVFQQKEDCYSDGDLSFEFSGNSPDRGMVLVEEYPTLAGVRRIDPDAAPAHLRYDYEGLVHGWLGELSLSDLLNLFRQVIKALRETDEVRWIRRINKAAGVKKKSEWQCLLSNAVSYLGSFINNRLMREEIDAKKFDGSVRFDHVGGDLFRNTAGREITVMADGFASAPTCGQQYYLSFNNRCAWLYAYDKSNRSIAGAITGVYPIFADFLDDDERALGKTVADGQWFVGGEFPGAAKDAPPAVESGETKRVAGVSVDDAAKAVFHLNRNDVYAVLEWSSESGGKYLKVVNDYGEEVWLSSERVTALIDEEMNIHVLSKPSAEAPDKNSSASAWLRWCGAMQSAISSV